MKRVIFMLFASVLVLHAQEDLSTEMLACNQDLKQVFIDITNHIPGEMRPSIKAVAYALAVDGCCTLPAQLVEMALVDAMQTIDSTDVRFAQELEKWWHEINNQTRKNRKRKIIDNLLVQQSVKVNNLAVGGTIFGTFAAANQVIGCSGITAPTGSTGFTGFTGNLGSQVDAQGGSGATGFTGPTGLTGLTGFTGPVGARGENGNTAFTGPTGDTGLAGATGSQGTVGSLGILGNTGSTGTSGATGATGGIGALGNSGFTGFTGATGTTGFTGSTGLLGSIGVQGPTGNTGPGGIAEAFAFGAIQASQTLTYQQQFPFTLLSSLNITLVGTSFTFSNPGTYEVSYTVNGFESGGNSSNQVQIYAIDSTGAVIESSIFGIGRPTATNTITQMVTGQFLIDVAAGDTLRLVNNTGTVGSTLTLAAGLFGPPITVATIYIRQIA